MKQLKMKHSIAAAQRNHLARTAARRQKQRQTRYFSRAVGPPSDRSKIKAKTQAAYRDQVELDKLNGLENGYLCRTVYKKACAKARPEVKRQKRKQAVRAAGNYRGKRRIAERGPRKSLLLRAERRASGETRSQADRRRKMAMEA
jgi:hypothetical protein